MTSTAVAHIVPEGDDPFRTRLIGGGQFAAIYAGQSAVTIHTVAQADSLIRAAVTAKDLLIAAGVKA